MTAEASAPGLLDKYKLVEKALRDRRLRRSTLAVAVLQCLIEHDGPRGIFPGKGRIARQCGTDPRTVREAIKRLAATGYIEIEHRFNPKTRRGQSNRYRIHYGKASDGRRGKGNSDDTCIKAIANYIYQNEKRILQTGGYLLECTTCWEDAMTLAEPILEKVITEHAEIHQIWAMLEEARKTDYPTDLDRLIIKVAGE